MKREHIWFVAGVAVGYLVVPMVIGLFSKPKAQASGN